MHFLVPFRRQKLGAVVALDAAFRLAIEFARLFGRFIRRRAALLKIGGALLGADFEPLEDRQRDDAVAFSKRNSAHAHRVPALEDAHVVDREADALASRGRQQHVVLVGADLNVDNALALIEAHGDLAAAVDLSEVGELVAPDSAARGGEHHVEGLPARFVLGQRHDRGDAFVRLQRQEIDQRLPARLRRGKRQAPDLLLVNLASRGKE